MPGDLASGGERAVQAGDRCRVDAGLVRGGGGLRARYVDVVVEVVEVADVRARLAGVAREPHLRLHALEARVDEVAAVAGERGVYHQRGRCRGLIRLSGEHRSGGDRPRGQHGCDMCTDERHTYEHTTYD